MQQTTFVKDLTEKQIVIIKTNAGKINTKKISELSGATQTCVRSYCRKYDIDLVIQKIKSHNREEWETEDGLFCIDGWSEYINRLFAIS